MKQIFYLVVTTIMAIAAISSSVAAQNSSGETLRLADNGKTAYVIALADDAIPAEKTAAEQLQKYFQEITGAAIAVQSESEVSDAAPQIVVGNAKRAKVLLPELNLEELGGDGIVIKTVGNKLILAGDRPRGSLYAVFQFLEDQGCNWWTPSESTIPHKSTFDIAPQNTIYVPQIKYRTERSTIILRVVPGGIAFNTMMRENDRANGQGEAWGGNSALIGWSHTFAQLLPVSKYFSQHPGWYSDPDNGYKPAPAQSRRPGEQSTQLCFSSPGIVEEMTKQALAAIDKDPSAGYISISQNDNTDGYCRDAAATELIKKEGSPSAPLLQFVNKVAAGINEKYPNFKIVTLAYNYSITPPKTIRPAKNVIVQLAPISADFGRPVDSPENTKMMDILRDWSKIAPEIFIWNYVTNFRNTMLPHPNWAGIGKDLRTFAANNVTGIYEQGDGYTKGVGDFNQLRTWLIAHLMWNPQLDQEQLTNKFLQGYYGAAAPYLKQYLDVITQSFLAQHRRLSTYNDDFSFITLDVANQATQLFDKAEEAVKDNPDQLRRVKRERLSISIGILHQYKELQEAAATANKQLLWPKNPEIAMNQFIADAYKAGVGQSSEGRMFYNQAPYLKSLFAPPPPLPAWAQKYPADDVVDIQSSRFWLGIPQAIMQADSAASSGYAATIVGDTKRWAIQLNVMQGEPYLPKGKWHIYGVARISVKKNVEQKGTAFSIGLYDPNSEDLSYSKGLSVADFADEKYQTIDLGIREIRDGAFIWVAPSNNPAVDRVYVDRIILVRAK